MSAPTITKACPTLAAPQPREAAAWYRDALGFTVALELDGYAIVARDGIELRFWQCPDRHVAENTSAYLRTEAPDALHAAFGQVGTGGRISPVMDREWGMREFHIHDPHGNLLKFGCPVAAAAA